MIPARRAAANGLASDRAQPQRFVGEISETLTDGGGELEAVTAEPDAHHDGTVAIQHEVIGGARRIQADGAAQRLRLDAGQPIRGVRLERPHGVRDLGRAVVRIDHRADAVQAGLDEPVRSAEPVRQRLTSLDEARPRLHRRPEERHRLGGHRDRRHQPRGDIRFEQTARPPRGRHHRNAGRHHVVRRCVTSTPIARTSDRAHRCLEANLRAGIDRLVPACVECAISVDPATVGLVQDRPVEPHPRPSRRGLERRQHLDTHPRRRARRFHRNQLGFIAVIDDPARMQQGATGTRLQRVPAGQRLLRQGHIRRVGVPESEDPLRPVRRAAIVTPSEAVDEQHRPAAASQRPRRRSPRHPSTDHDDIRHHDSLHHGRRLIARHRATGRRVLPLGAIPLGGDLGEHGVDLGHAGLHAFEYAHGDRLLHPFQ